MKNVIICTKSAIKFKVTHFDDGVFQRSCFVLITKEANNIRACAISPTFFHSYISRNNIFVRQIVTSSRICELSSTVSKCRLKKLRSIKKRANFANMGKPKVLVPSSDTPKAGLDLLRETCELTIMPEQSPNREQILAAIPGHDAIFLSVHTDINSDFLDIAGPSLKVVSTMSAGYDHLDVPEIKRRGIKVGHTPNVLQAAVAEIAVMLMLDAAKRAHEGRLKLESGQIERRPQWLLGQELRDSVVGIVGYGSIGHGIVKRLCGFEVKSILYTGHSRKKEELGAKFVSLDELLEQSDFVVVAVPLNNETRGLFDDVQFAKMKRTAVFVNISRGAVVKTDSLVKALRENIIFAAGLDVTDPEPLPIDHVLLKLPNAVVLPHIGSATVRTRNDMARIAAINIINGLAGKPLMYPL